jgi:hypothetical protein
MSYIFAQLDMIHEFHNGLLKDWKSGRYQVYLIRHDIGWDRHTHVTRLNRLMGSLSAACGLLLAESIVRPVFSVSALTWLIRYICH